MQGFELPVARKHTWVPFSRGCDLWRPSFTYLR